MQRLTGFAISFFSLALVVYVLASASQFFIPIVVALVIAYMLTTIGEGIARWMPRWLAFIVAVGLILLGGWVMMLIVGRNVAALVEAIPAYQERMRELMTQGFGLFGQKPPRLLDSLDQVDLIPIARGIVLMITEIAGFAGMITIYVIFLLIEYQFFDEKLAALVKNDTNRASAQAMLSKINRQVQSYVWIKTWLSLLTASLSYGVLKFVGVDFAEFWALLIFLLNFIPTF
ncbi:unnamed protein product, partial [marine sediment metagenome]